MTGVQTCALPIYDLKGNNGADTLDGGLGDDDLKGNGGDDNLDGGDGDDNLKGNGGDDDLYGGAGNDVLAGGGGDDYLNGGDGDDVMKGGGGADTIDGGAGNDTLKVEGDGDTYLGGDGDDVFKFNELAAPGKEATIGDFTSGADKMLLDAETFTVLTAIVGNDSPLSADEFVANATGQAGDANDFIVYNTSTGELYYDADGNGGGEGVLLATYTGMPALTADDFLVHG